MATGLKIEQGFKSSPLSRGLTLLIQYVDLLPTNRRTVKQGFTLWSMICNRDEWEGLAAGSVACYLYLTAVTLSAEAKA